MMLTMQEGTGQALWRRLRAAAAVGVAALLVAACGGDSECPSAPPFEGAQPASCADSGGGTNEAPKVATIEVLASSTEVGSAGAPVTITAVVKDAGNVALPNTTVQFSASDGRLTDATALTDESGVATAKFAPGADKSNRQSVVTVNSGGKSAQVTLDIAGTKLAYSGPTTVQFGGTAKLSIKATDSAGAAIPNLVVALASSLGNGLSATSLATNSQGIGEVTYTATAAGTDTVTFQGAGTSVSTSMQISGEDFAISAPVPGQRIAIGTNEVVTARYLVSGLPGAGSYVVRFATTLGAISPSTAANPGVPLVNGAASAGVQSLAAGPGTVQATLVNTITNLPVAQTSVPVQFVATTPAKLVLQVTPSSLGPNATGSTARQVQALATVTDANGNLVEGVTVNFAKVSDPSGGNLSQVSAVTNSNGQASVQYYSGAVSTPSGGVVLSATVAGTAVSGNAALTVNQSALFIALGTGNTITNVNETTYQKVWTVYVTDSSGAAVPNQQVTVSVLPTRYRKGSFVLAGDEWVYGEYAGGPLSPEGEMAAGNYKTCPNEDTDYTGVYSTTKDKNNNQRLDPGNVISVNGGTNVTTVTTDANGFALLDLRYAESYASWVEVKLRAGATVAGTESSNEAVFFAPGLASDYTKAGGPPAGVVSPFGQNADCNQKN